MGAGLQEADWIWRDGEFVPWGDAQLHLLSTAVQFGTSVFEGMRAYATPNGPAIFRLDAHIRRLFDSAKIYRMVPDHTPEQLAAVTREIVVKNELEDCYIRPMILRGYGSPGLMPFDSPIDTYVAAWAWGAYLGDEALLNGVDVCVSTWQRALPNTFPARAKAGGQYVNAQLMKMEAVQNGYTDAIALGPGGLVSEGTGMNIFLVDDGVIITPTLDGTSLVGITRGAVIQMAEDLGYEVRREPVPRESLYTVDEIFFTGTAAAADRSGLRYSAAVSELFAVGFSAAHTNNWALVETVHRELHNRTDPKTHASQSQDGVGGWIMAQQLEALLVLNRGNTQRALQLLKEAAQEEEDMPYDYGPPYPIKPSHELLGEVLLSLDKPIEAQTHFQQALSRTTNRTLSKKGLLQATRSEKE